MKKENALSALSDLPEEFDVEELIERLLFKEKVELGLTQIDQKKTKPHEEVKEMVKKWQV